MAIFYTHPRVDISKTAITRKTLTESNPDSIRLFAPFKSSYGPTNEIKILHTEADFIANYGEFNFNQQGQNVLNIRNWLRNGGTVYAMRADDDGGVNASVLKSDKATYDFTINRNVISDSSTMSRAVLKDSVDFSSNLYRLTVSKNYVSTFMLLFKISADTNEIIDLCNVGHYQTNTTFFENDTYNIETEIDLVFDLGKPYNRLQESTIKDGFFNSSLAKYVLYNPITEASTILTDEQIEQFTTESYLGELGTYILNKATIQVGPGGVYIPQKPIGFNMFVSEGRNTTGYISGIAVLDKDNSDLITQANFHTVQYYQEKYCEKIFDLYEFNPDQQKYIKNHEGFKYNNNQIGLSRALFDPTLYEFDSENNSVTLKDPNSWYDYIMISRALDQSEQYIYPDVIDVYRDYIAVKYSGVGYNHLLISAKESTEAYDISLYLGSTTNLVEKFKVPKNNIDALKGIDNQLSSYIYIVDKKYFVSGTEEQVDDAASIEAIENALISDFNVDMSVNILKTLADSTKDTLLKFGGGTDTLASQDQLVKHILSNNATQNIIKDKLKYPIDLVLDAGYSFETKEALYTAFCTDDTTPGFIRSDVFVYLDSYPLYSDLPTLGERTESLYTELSSLPRTDAGRNAAFYEFYYKIKNPLTSSQDYVTPTYYLSQLIPVSVLNNGAHMPIAGMNRGVLSDVLYCSENPLGDRKEELFGDAFNYSESTATTTYFASQRTREPKSSNTALQFINNSLTTNIIVKELERLGREYLFEYNDAITLANLRKSLNSYVQDYVVKNTLSYASVNVEKDPTSPDTLQIQLNIKFVGTVEVIKIDLTVE